MLELHAVKLTKAIHKKTQNLAITGLNRREVKAIRQKNATQQHAQNIRESAMETIEYSKALHLEALRTASKAQKKIQDVRDVIRAG